MNFDLDDKPVDQYDLDTEQGMQNAVAWLQGMIGLLKDGGTWLVPRSGSVYTVHPQAKKAERTINGEACIDRVFEAAGWTVQ